MPEIIKKIKDVSLREFLTLKAPMRGLEVRVAIGGYGHSTAYIGLPLSRLSWGTHYNFHKVGRVLDNTLEVMDPTWHSDLFDLLAQYERVLGEPTKMLYTTDPLEEGKTSDEINKEK